MYLNFATFPNNAEEVATHIKEFTVAGMNG